MILRNGPSATNLRQQLGQLPRVTHTIIAVTVVHQHVHLVRLFGEATIGVSQPFSCSSE
jgi:hypothetical protein